MAETLRQSLCMSCLSDCLLAIMQDNDESVLLAWNSAIVEVSVRCFYS
jgi:hypothetical protein